MMASIGLSISFLITILLFSINNVSGDSIFDDIKRNVTQLISSKGYPVEEHEVTTADGYILSVQRIPHGVTNNQTNGKVVYLQHGVMGASSDFVLNPANSSLAFILADAGYDVWLANVRGNTYSRKHVKYTDRQSQFWDFTFDHMANYDLPAVIDFILNATGQEQLYYIGHSQGTTVLFAMLADNPAYNDKIKLAIALAPVVFESHVRGFLRYISPFASVIQTALHWIGQDEFLPGNGLIQTASELFCNTPYKLICKNVAFLIGGTDTDQLDTARLPVYAGHFPAGTSAINMVHHTQLQSSGRFQKFDHGMVTNLWKYGQMKPPQYEIEKITTPIVLIWGDNDNLSAAPDVETLRTKLRSLRKHIRVQFAKWSHFDYVLAKDARKYLHGEILDVLSSH